MAEISDQQSRQRAIKGMGRELGVVFHRLKNEYFHLCFLWEEYVQLFGTSPARIDLLNQSAPHFFSILDSVFFQSALLAIARLTDPPTTGLKTNLTLTQLPQLISNPKADKKIKRQISTVLRKTKFCRDWRNRYIAHRDRDLEIAIRPRRLKKASRQRVHLAIESIRQTLCLVSEFFLDEEIVFASGMSSMGAHALLYVIRDGLRARDEQSRSIRARTFRYKGFEPV